MNTFLKILLPLLVLGVGGGAAWWLVKTKPETPPPDHTAPALLVRVESPAREKLRLSVKVHGTVLPRTETDLFAQVTGRVVEVAPSFERGGFFEPGARLVRIDPTDYELALASAEARVAQAKVRVAREEAEAALARKEWEAFGEGEPDPLVLRIPQLAEARASLASAEAAVRMAALNLRRTEIGAPFAGRVRVKHVDVGQVVGPNSPLARIYAVDYAEVRLPVPTDELAFLDLPFNVPAGKGPEVIIRWAFAGRTHERKARIVRTEAEIDPRTRMIHAVARIEDPYGRAADGDAPPLMVGQFVEAEIQGRTVEGVRIVSRQAVYGGSRVWLVDGNDTLRPRTVEVLRTEGDRAILSSGLEDGDRVCVSPLDMPVEGRKVRVHAE